MIRSIKESKMKPYTKSQVSFGQQPQNTSARAPGSNGPQPPAPQSISSQAGRVVVQSNPGEPSAIAETQVHAKSRQVETRPAHSDREMRGKRGDGTLVLEAGAANAACVDNAS
jgi:hypothetical protein